MSETDVRRGLRVAAARLEVEAPPVRELAQRGRARGRGRAFAAGGSVLGLVVAAGLVGTVFTTVVTRQAASPEADTRGQDQELQEVLEPGERERLGRLEPENFTQTASGTSTAPPDVDTPLQSQGRIVKRAEIRVEVPAGEFGGVYAQAQRLAADHGGFVHEAETEGERARSGSLVLRIPSDRFEEALADLKGLGLVLHEKVTGQDVTSDFIDLRARLRNWLAQERAVRGFLAEADTLEETLRIHGQLQEIEVQIEQIKGNLRVLRDRSSLGTVALQLHEEGAALAEANDPAPGALTTAWRRAIAASTEVVAAVVVGLGYLLPILVLLALGWLAFRSVRPRARA